MTEDFKNGMTAGVVLAIAECLRQGYSQMGESLRTSAKIKSDEELSFCSDFDLQALREHLPEFADVYGDDFEPDEPEQPS